MLTDAHNHCEPSGGAQQRIPPNFRNPKGLTPAGALMLHHGKHFAAISDPAKLPGLSSRAYCASCATARFFLKDLGGLILETT